MNEPQPILVADDDLELCRLCKMAFSRKGWAAEVVCDGAQALARLSERRFGVGVLDYRMPGLTGLEVLQKSKEMGVQTAIVILTGYGTIPMAVQCMREGADEFLTKPVSITTLIDTVEGLLWREGSSVNILADRLDDRLKTLSSAPDLSLSELAHGLHVSEGYASRLLRIRFGVSFQGRMAAHRVNRAKRLLVSTDEPIKSIACRSGFKNQTRLTEAFKRAGEPAPRKYREICVDERKKCRWAGNLRVAEHI
jgi:YesN/AraC family two-component response regulator